MDEISLFAIPFKMLVNFISFTNNIFCGKCAKIFIVNPSFSLNNSWKMIKNLLTVEQNESN